MKRIHVPGIVDIVQSDDAAEIKSLAQDENLDRAYSDLSVLANGHILRQLREVLQIDGKPFPTVAPRCAPGRAEAQDALWKRLSSLAPSYAAGPAALEPLAAFVRGEGAPDSMRSPRTTGGRGSVCCGFQGVASKLGCRCASR